MSSLRPPMTQTFAKAETRIRLSGPERWTADGATASFFSFPYPTRMALIRLADGGLFVWSPIALATELKAKVEDWGDPKFLVSPNKLHHLFLGEWKAAYPPARFFASPACVRVERTSPSTPTSPTRRTRAGPGRSTSSCSRAAS
ncbi:MAG: hypothetical protein WAK01_02225 [Methylocystis sp.]